MLPCIDQAEDVAKEAVKSFIIDNIKEFYSYLRKYRENVSQLEKTHQDLLDCEIDMRREVDIGQRKLQKITEEADSWLKSVCKLVVEDDELNQLIDLDTRKAMELRCFGINLYVRYKMSKLADEKAQELSNTIKKRPLGALTLPILAADLECIPTEFLKGLKSREELLDRVLEKLGDDQVRAVGVYGMGAIGKTVLVKEIANNKSKHMFDRVVMVEVSETPNIENIQDQLAEAIDLPLNDVHTLELRAKKLYNALKLTKKRDDDGNTSTEKGDNDKGSMIMILVVIDNIWGRFELEKVGIPYEWTIEFRCKILVTSREKNVCEVMGVEDRNVFKIESLKDEESKQLFRKRVGMMKMVVDESVENRLLSRCGGLPLAVVALADVLRDQDSTIWKRFADELEKSLWGQVGGVHRETYSILETSYQLMDSKEKQMFFLLACLFPQGSSIPVDEMMRYGIGLGLIQHVNNLTEAMDLTNAWIHDLVSSSLLLQDDAHGRVKIHDVVRASAISFAAKDGHKFMVESIPRWIWEETCKTLTAISLTSAGHDHSEHLDGLKSDKLKLLQLKGNRNSQFSDTFFQGMKNLKVLVLSGVKFEQSLPRSLSALKSIRTMHLEYCKLTDIGLISLLVNLMVLSLRGSEVTELPDEFRNLINLRLLDLSGCTSKLETIPANLISNMSKLEGLYMYDSFVNWEKLGAKSSKEQSRKASIGELKALRYLKVLEMHIPSLEQFPTGEQLVENTGEQFLENLDKFAVCVGGTNDMSLKESALTRVVLLKEIGGSTLSNYDCLKALLRKTDFLKLHNITHLKYLIPELDKDGFRELKNLEVQSCDDVEYIVSSHRMSKKIALRSLDSLLLKRMKNLKLICDDIAPAGMFCNLKHITLHSLSNLQPYALPIDQARNLVDIQVRYCYNVKFIFMMHSQVNDEIDAMELPDLVEMELISLSSFSSMVGSENDCVTGPDEQIQPVSPALLISNKIRFPSLDRLKLDGLPIQNLWNLPRKAFTEGSVRDKSFDVYRFQNLKTLEIESCHELKTLGPPSVIFALERLERLSIKMCRAMEEVLTAEATVDEIPEKIIVFPNLKYLCLQHLKNIRSFYQGGFELQFPALKELDLKLLNKDMTSFAFQSQSSTPFFHSKIGFPCLEKFLMNVVEERVEKLWDISVNTKGSSNTTSNPIPKLKNLSLMSAKNGLKVIPQGILQNLTHLEVRESDDTVLLQTSESVKWEELSLQKCFSLEELFNDQAAGDVSENEDHVAHVFCGQLKWLDLHTLPKLKPIPLHLFKSLCYLHLYNIFWNFVFSADLVDRSFGQLLSLEELIISTCHEVEVVIEDNEVSVSDDEDEDEDVVFKDEVISFPRLKFIRLYQLGKLRNFNSRSYASLHMPMLERLEIASCNEFKSFSPGPVNAPNLNQVMLRRCNSMLSFSSRRLRAPMLSKVQLDDEQMEEGDDINLFLQNRYRRKYFTRNGYENHVRDDIA